MTSTSRVPHRLAVDICILRECSWSAASDIKPTMRRYCAVTSAAGPSATRCALLQQEDPVAVQVQGGQVVADQDDGAPLALVVGEDIETLLLEARVAHREHLVHQQDVRVGLDRDREGQAHRHARGEVLDLLVGEILELRKLEDVVDAPGQLLARDAEDGATEEDVLARRQLRVEANAELEERRDAAASRPVPSSGRRSASRSSAGCSCRIRSGR